MLHAIQSPTHCSANLHVGLPDSAESHGDFWGGFEQVLEERCVLSKRCCLRKGVQQSFSMPTAQVEGSQARIQQETSAIELASEEPPRATPLNCQNCGRILGEVDERIACRVCGRLWEFGLRMLWCLFSFSSGFCGGFSKWASQPAFVTAKDSQQHPPIPWCTFARL